jgi:magnesium chelatase family protein
VARARERQIARQHKTNVRLAPREVDAHCSPDPEGAALLGKAISRLGLSARGYHRVLKVARTIADLDDCARIHASHVAVAVRYRAMDRSPRM